MAIPRQSLGSCRADVHRPRRTGLGQTHLPVSGYSKSGSEKPGLSNAKRQPLLVRRFDFNPLYIERLYAARAFHT